MAAVRTFPVNYLLRNGDHLPDFDARCLSVCLCVSAVSLLTVFNELKWRESLVV